MTIEILINININVVLLTPKYMEYENTLHQLFLLPFLDKVFQMYYYSRHQSYILILWITCVLERIISMNIREYKPEGKISWCKAIYSFKPRNVMNKHMSINLLGMRLCEIASIYKTIKSATQEGMYENLFLITYAKKRYA